MTRRERIYNEAELYINTDLSIRELAEELDMCKSTLHDHLNIRLQEYDLSLYKKVKKVAALKHSYLSNRNH